MFPSCKDPPQPPGSTGIRPEWKRGRSQAGKEEKRVGRLASCQPPRSPSGSAGSSCRQRGFSLTCGAGSPGRRSPATMILWLWLCWGFSTSAGQPDSELMARYLEEKLMADYSIMEQVGFKAVVVWEHVVPGAGLSVPS